MQNVDISLLPIPPILTQKTQKTTRIALLSTNYGHLYYQVPPIPTYKTQTKEVQQCFIQVLLKSQDVSSVKSTYRLFSNFRCVHQKYHEELSITYRAIKKGLMRRFSQQIL